MNNILRFLVNILSSTSTTSHTFTVKTNTFYFIPIACTSIVANGVQVTSAFAAGTTVFTGNSTILIVLLGTAASLTITEVKVLS